jgi:hypothetical protein
LSSRERERKERKIAYKYDRLWEEEWESYAYLETNIDLLSHNLGNLFHSVANPIKILKP